VSPSNRNHAANPPYPAQMPAPVIRNHSNVERDWEPENRNSPQATAMPVIPKTMARPTPKAVPSARPNRNCTLYIPPRQELFTTVVLIPNYEASVSSRFGPNVCQSSARPRHPREWRGRTHSEPIFCPCLTPSRFSKAVEAPRAMYETNCFCAE